MVVAATLSDFQSNRLAVTDIFYFFKGLIFVIIMLMVVYYVLIILIRPQDFFFNFLPQRHFRVVFTSFYR